MADRRYRAVLIGNANYPRDPHAFPALHGPLIDIEELRHALTDRAVGLFRPDDILSFPDSGVQHLREALDTFFSDAVREDVLLLYYSGHGQLDERGKLYLCAADTLAAGLRSTALSAVEITGMIETSAATTIIIVLDCCHSGAFKAGAGPVAPTDGLVTPVAGKGRYVLTSNRSTQLARAAAAPGRPSPFTAMLARGLRHAEARGHPGHLTVTELYQQVHRWMTEHSSLAPQLRFAGEGEVIIARRRPPVSTPPSPGRPERPPSPGRPVRAAPEARLSRASPPAPWAPAAGPRTGPTARPGRATPVTAGSDAGTGSRTKVRYRLYNPAYHRRISLAGSLVGLGFLAVCVIIAMSDTPVDPGITVLMFAFGSMTVRVHWWLHRLPLSVFVTDDFLRVAKEGRSRDYAWDEISKISMTGKTSEKHVFFLLHNAAGDLVESMALPTITRRQWQDFAEAVHRRAAHVTVQDRVNAG